MYSHIPSTFPHITIRKTGRNSYQYPTPVLSIAAHCAHSGALLQSYFVCFILRSRLTTRIECRKLLIRAAGFCFCCKPDLAAKFWRLTGVVFSIGTSGAIDLSSSFPVNFFIHRYRGEQCEDKECCCHCSGHYAHRQQPKQPVSDKAYGGQLERSDGG